ncbi:MAG: NAD(P)-dependent oxidoreductase [Candidatus Aminicenantes bacterium]|nr:NAD(P)-dependent oxidoreductase [Candidatus Aminicenantes bacterium]
MKILVTGGTGFIGSHLIRELLKDSRNQVYALIRDDIKLASFDFKNNITAIRGDLFRSEQFPANIELVFHLAALTKIVSPQEFIHINHEGTLSLLEKLKPLKNLQKVILLSSLAAAGPNREQPVLREEMPAQPISLYGKSKLAQERLFPEQCPAPHIIIRAPIVFGPGDMDMLEAFRMVRKGMIPVLGKKERWYSVIYVKDLVRGMIAAAASLCQNEVFYIANAQPVEWQSFLEEVSRLLGRKKIRKIVIPEILGRILAELSEMRIRTFKRKAIFNRDKFNEMKFPAWVCSAEKIGNLLHFQPQIPLLEALQETIHWYQEQKML